MLYAKLLICDLHGLLLLRGGHYTAVSTKNQTPQWQRYLRASEAMLLAGLNGSAGSAQRILSIVQSFCITAFARRPEIKEPLVLTAPVRRAALFSVCSEGEKGFDKIISVARSIFQTTRLHEQRANRFAVCSLSRIVFRALVCSAHFSLCASWGQARLNLKHAWHGAAQPLPNITDSQSKLSDENAAQRIRRYHELWRRCCLVVLQTIRVSMMTVRRS